MIKKIDEIKKYSFHWQDEHAQLIRRWDNAPHYPNLPNAPHHVHESDGSIASIKTLPDIFQIFQEIENHLKT